MYVGMRGNGVAVVRTQYSSGGRRVHYSALDRVNHFSKGCDPEPFLAFPLSVGAAFLIHATFDAMRATARVPDARHLHGAGGETWPRHSPKTKG